MLCPGLLILTSHGCIEGDNRCFWLIRWKLELDNGNRFRIGLRIPVRAAALSHQVGIEQKHRIPRRQDWEACMCLKLKGTFGKVSFPKLKRAEFLVLIETPDIELTLSTEGEDSIGNAKMEIPAVF